jgi:hypothetical protein
LGCIPVDMSRIFAKPLCARDRHRSSKKSLNLGYNNSIGTKIQSAFVNVCLFGSRYLAMAG